MSYASRIGFSTKVAVDSEALSERAGVGVAVGLAAGEGEGGDLAFCGGLRAAGGGVTIWPFSLAFSEGSITLDKRGIFGVLSWEIVALVTTLPLTRRSRFPELAT